MPRETWRDPKSGKAIKGEVLHQGFLCIKPDPFLTAPWQLRWVKHIVEDLVFKNGQTNILPTCWLLLCKVEPYEYMEKSPLPSDHVIMDLIRSITEADRSRNEQKAWESILDIQGAILLNEIDKLKEQPEIDAPYDLVQASPFQSESIHDDSGFDLVSKGPAPKIYRIWDKDNIYDHHGWAQQILAFTPSITPEYAMGGIGKKYKTPQSPNGEFKITIGKGSEAKTTRLSLLVPDRYSANKLYKGYIVAQSSAAGSFGKIRYGMESEGKKDILAIKEVHNQYTHPASPPPGPKKEVPKQTTAPQQNLFKLFFAPKKKSVPNPQPLPKQQEKPRKVTQDSVLKDFDKEIELMKKLQSKAKIIDKIVVRSPKDPKRGIKAYMVMNLMCPSTSLRKDLKEQQDGRSLLRLLLWDIANDLNTCHQKHYVHRDLKPGNIFASMDGTFALMDYGTCVTEGHNGSLAGTKGYIRPITVKQFDEFRTYKASWSHDLYALAITWIVWAGFLITNYSERDISEAMDKLDSNETRTKTGINYTDWAGRNKSHAVSQFLKELYEFDQDIFSFIFSNILSRSDENYCSANDIIALLGKNLHFNTNEIVLARKRLKMVIENSTFIKEAMQYKSALEKQRELFMKLVKQTSGFQTA